MRRLEWDDPAIPNRQLYKDQETIPYSGTGNPRQILVVHCPKQGKDHAVILWIHGGGLTEDIRECPDALFDGKRILVEVRHRLADEASPAEILEDAVRAALWTLHHIAGYGGDPGKCFFGGMSAGCYLAAMIAFDRKRLLKYDGNLPDFAGLLLVSGQYSTHFCVKSILHPEHPRYLPMLDEYAPMSYLSTKLPPMIIVSGEPGRDMPARSEESAYTAASLKAMGHPDVEYIRLPECSHGECMDHSGSYLVRFIERIQPSG